MLTGSPAAPRRRSAPTARLLASSWPRTAAAPRRLSAQVGSWSGVSDSRPWMIASRWPSTTRWLSVFNIRGPSWRMREHQPSLRPPTAPTTTRPTPEAAVAAQPPHRNDDDDLRHLRPALRALRPSPSLRRRPSGPSLEAAPHPARRPSPAAGQAPSASRHRLPVRRVQRTSARIPTLRRLPPVDAGHRHGRIMSKLRGARRRRGPHRRGWLLTWPTEGHHPANRDFR